ncbi:hypothetical protein G5B46_20385 [Caulobacter sp. 602-2]|uniref:DUF6916 domain-containing protein n=1 Tax=Caulobacter sp. 602-2 TaxID=2710887 RepID=A0A6G4R3B1_9CAUL|nr:hypothetical protein [Caulobacter sp. 602-2]NGM51975.1 hypothetical protein [Caulobacter sp. 602-2]
MLLLKPEDFEAWVGKQVRVATVPHPVEITLAAIFRPGYPNDIREPFSLMFESPMNISLIDGAYEFDCGKGGPHTIVITQLKPLPNARVYQAIFN